MESVRRSIGWLVVIGALAVLPVAACGGSDGPQRGVTVSDLAQKQYFYRGNQLGRTVTVSAAVSEVDGSRVFKLSGGDSSDDLLVLTAQPVDVAKDQEVRVTGTVGQLHHSAPSERVPYLQRDLYDKHDTETYLYDATVQRR